MRRALLVGLALLAPAPAAHAADQAQLNRFADGIAR